jgi:uroporphyrinogen decarboxylase
MREIEGTGKPLLRALHGETLTMPPIWLMRQAGRYLPEYRRLRQRATKFLDLCLTPELAAEATLQPVRRFGLDAAILFSDILIVPHALGQALDYREGEGPVLPPIVDTEAFAALDDRGFDDKIAPVWRTVERVKTVLADEVALIGFAGGAWTVACYMVEGGWSRDFAAVKRWSMSDPAGFGALIDRVVDATIAYLDGQIAAGADAIQLFDSWAGILAEAEFRRWVIAPTQRIVAALKQHHPRIPVIGFPRGAGLMYRDYFTETGIDALGLDQMVPLGVARKTLQSRGPVQGNLDPILLVTGGEAMRDRAAEIVTAFGSGPFVFNLGHGVLPETPPDHVAQLVEFVRNQARGMA